MKRFSLIFFLSISLCLIQNMVTAQRVAGYMGKRFFVGVPVSYMPNLLGLLSDDVNYNGKSNFYMINAPKIGASVGFVASNTRSIVLDVDFQNIGGLFVDPDNYASSPTDLLYGRSKLVTYKFRFQKAFQHCAPVGGYRGITLGLTTFNNSYMNVGGDEQAADRVIDYSFGYAGGLRRVYKDKIMLDLGLECNFSFKTIGAFIYTETLYKTNEQKVGNYAIIKNGFNNIIVCRAALYLLL